MPLDLNQLISQTQNRRLQQQVSSQKQKVKALGGTPKKGGPSMLSRIFDVISRPLYGVSEGLARASERQNPVEVLKGAVGGLAGKNKTDFGETLLRAAEHDKGSILSKAIRENKGNIRSIAGFAGDVVLDPTSYIGAGVVKSGGKAAAKTLATKTVVEHLGSEAIQETLRKAGQRAVAEESAKLAESGGKALSEKAIKKVAKKAEEKASVEIGKPVFKEAYEKAVTNAPGKVQLKVREIMPWQHGEHVLAESEKLYKAGAKIGEKFGATKFGEKFNAAFRTSHLLPEETKNISRRMMQAGVKGTEQDIRAWRKFLKERGVTPEQERMISHSMERGNINLSPEDRAILEAKIHIPEPAVTFGGEARATVGGSAAPSRLLKGAPRTVDEARAVRAQLGKLIEGDDWRAADKAWEQWETLKNSTDPEIWREAERLDKEAHYGGRMRSESAAALPDDVYDVPFTKADQTLQGKRIKPTTVEDIIGRTTAQVKADAAAVKEATTGTGLGIKKVEVGKKKYEWHVQKDGRTISSHASRREAQEAVVEHAGTLPKAAEDLDILSQGAPKLPAAEPKIQTGPYKGKTVSEAQAIQAEAEGKVKAAKSAGEARKEQEVVDEIKSVIPQAKPEPTPLKQVTEKLKEEPKPKPLSKAAQERAVKAEQAAKTLDKQIDDLDTRVSKLEEHKKSVQKSLKEHEEVLKAAESAQKGQEAAEQAYRITRQGPLHGKTVAEAEAYLRRLVEHVKPLPVGPEREKFAKMIRATRTTIEEAKGEAASAMEKLEKQAASLTRAKVHAPKERKVLEELEPKINELKSKRAELGKQRDARIAESGRSAVGKLHEMLQKGKPAAKEAAAEDTVRITAKDITKNPNQLDTKIGGHATRIEFTPDVFNITSAIERSQLVRQIDRLQRTGWVKTVLDDGTHVFEWRPAAKAVEEAAPKATLRELMPGVPAGPTKIQKVMERLAASREGAAHGPAIPMGAAPKPPILEDVARKLRSAAEGVPPPEATARAVEDETIPSMLKAASHPEDAYRSDLHGVKTATGHDLGEIVDEARRRFRQMGEIEADLGIFKSLKGRSAREHLRDEYVYHFYRGGTEETREANKELRRKIFGSDTPTFTKKRTIATLEAAKQKGLDPVEEIGDIMALRMGKHFNAVARKQFVEEVTKQYGTKISSRAAQAVAKENGLRTAKGVPGLKDVYFPDKIARTIEAHSVIHGSTKAGNDLLRFFDKVQSNWKFLATGANPGHHIRNMIGDAWNAYLDGVANPRFYNSGARIMAAKESASVSAKIGRGMVDGEHAMSEWIRSGAAPGFFSSEFASGKGVKQKILELGEKREEYMRFSHFLGAWHDEALKIPKGLSPEKYEARLAEAANRAGDRVRKWAVDYGDVTEFESAVVKRVVPFYTWTRKNLPLQLEALATHPGRISVIPKGQAAIQRMMGQDSGYNQIDPSAVIPKWMKEMAPIRLSGEMYGIPPLPFQDVTKYTEGGKQGILRSIISQLTPAARIPIEQATGQSLFSGAPIKSDVQYFSQQVPWLRIMNALREGSLTKEQAANYLTGAGVYRVGPQQVASELRRQQQSLKTQIRQGRQKARNG